MKQKQRYWLFGRSHVYYLEDSLTGEQKSLKTLDPKEAQRILDAKHEATQSPLLGIIQNVEELFQARGRLKAFHTVHASP